MLRFTTFLLLGFCLFSRAATVSGRITDTKGDELPFVNIYVKNTGRSTTSNINGKYFLELSSGTHTLVFKMVGYKTLEKTLEITGSITLDIVMEEVVYNLGQVDIVANAEDPAYGIIRKAIKMRKHYLEQVNTFSCDVYTKGLQRLTSFPKKFMGMEVDPRGEIDSVTGIIYLSESVSKYYFRQPGKVKEIMISSRVSGNNKAFSYNKASEMFFNFYENLLVVPALSDRGFVSPIAASAMLYYKYRLAGTFYENDMLVNKIEVIPRRKADPCFRGYIYIQENTWRVHSTELMLTRDAQIDFVDTLRIEQVHFPVTQDVWMVLSNNFTFSFGFFAFKGNGHFIGVNSGYVLEPDLPEKFFSNEEWKVEDDANKKDSAYWSRIRPVPLTGEEKGDYQKRDSMEKIRSSEPYLDSVDRVTNKLKLSKLLFTGYTFTRRYKKRDWEFSPLISNISFNTVRGWVAGISINREQELQKDRRYTIGLSGSYGFEDASVNGEGFLNWNYDRKKFARIRLSGGAGTPQINEQNPVGTFLNTLYTLLDESNHAKYYRKEYAYAEHDREFFNGVYVRTIAEYAGKRPLFNRSDYHWVDYENREYLSNNPVHRDDDYFASFSAYSIFRLTASLRLRIAQKYYTRPNRKIIVGSKWPTLVCSYSKAIPGVFGSSADYDELRVTVYDEIKLRLAGTTTYTVSWGTFLNNRLIPLPERRHFLGNQTHFSDFGLQRFNMLPYYEYSTIGEYAEAHLEHKFGGMIISKIPLIRRLKLKESAGVHYLWSRSSGRLFPSNPDHYLEAFFGLERLNLIRADVIFSFPGFQKAGVGFRVGVFFD